MKGYTGILLAMAFFISVGSSCAQSPGQEGSAPSGSSTDGSDQPYVRLETYVPGRSEPSAGVVMRELRDPQTGMVTMYMPLPANWKVTEQGMQGGEGTNLVEYPGASFMDYQRSIGSIDDILAQDIAQFIQTNGAQYLGTIDLPEVAERDERLGRQYWDAMPMEKRYQAKGVEILGANGQPVLLIVHYTRSSSQVGTHHSYYLHILTSTDARYEVEKQAVRYALANRQSNPEAVVAFNQRTQQEYVRRERMHDIKMQQAWDHFNTWNRNHVETWNDINESSMASWRRQEAMRDAGQARSVDGILERERLVSPFDGKELEVKAGYTHYFTNAFGEVIGSNDAFFDPARDPSLNHQEWRRVEGGNR